MLISRRPQIYWANALFAEADRNFNAACVSRLRAAGHHVFLPQEAAVNEEAAPTAEDIFRVDTGEVLNSELLVACLDQETIDCGVACEIGLAYSWGIPIVGLYTDIRQHRQGPGRMYKNLYVVGAIEASGKVTTSLDELMEAINGLLPSAECRAPVRPAAVDAFSHLAPAYPAFVRELETWYEPGWNVLPLVGKWVRAIGASRVLEIGCGPGDVGRYLCASEAAISYVGYDLSAAMIEAARSAYQNERCVYTSQLADVIARAETAPFDLALALFTLHDHPSKVESIARMRDFVRPGGLILVVDLCVRDLARLTDALKIACASPDRAPDPRIDPASLALTARELRLELHHCELSLPAVRFASFDDLDRYLDFFGVYSGLDLPLALNPARAPMARARIKRFFAGVEFPFIDQRVFITCVVQRPS